MQGGTSVRDASGTRNGRGGGGAGIAAIVLVMDMWVATIDC